MSQTTLAIDRAAILHIPLSQYAYAISENGITIRLRAKKGDLTCCKVYTADRVDRETPVHFTEFLMQLFATDGIFDYFSVDIEVPYNRICYYFKLEKETEWTYYYSDRFSELLPDKVIDDKIIDCRSEYYQYPFILREEIPDVPQWFKEATVYNIFPDSFANGRRLLNIKTSEHILENGVKIKNRLGGSIRGITNNLEYIKSMGFNCIYLNPIFTAGEYHKYDVIDYYHVDPCLGTDEDFYNLVDTAHSKGIRVIIDGVFNHCSWKFFAFDDVVMNGAASIYKDWFYDIPIPLVIPDNAEEIPNYTCFAYECKMPKLNTSNHDVQLYFANVGKYWIEKYHIDGWRLDVANEVSREFWANFRYTVKMSNPEAVLIGEVWENAQTWLRGNAFDSTMNYEFRRICVEFLTSEKPNGVKAAYEFEKMRLRYPENIVMGQLNLLDSHDVPRFLSMCHGDTKLWQLGCVLLMLMPGIPSLFYGDEFEIEGVLENEYRQPMPWNDKNKLQQFIRKLADIRKNYIGRNGTYRPLWELIHGGVFAFCREGNAKTLKVIVNAGDLPINYHNIIQGKEEVLLASEEIQISPKGYLIYLDCD